MMADEALHPLTNDLVDRFALALKEKLLASQIKYGWADDWARDDWQERCQASLLDHIGKGDPRDVAAFAAFMWHHDWPTATRPAPKADSALVGDIRASVKEIWPVHSRPSADEFADVLIGNLKCRSPEALAALTGEGDAALSDRDVVLEEAAKVAEDWTGPAFSGHEVAQKIAKDIRSLKGGVDE